MEDGKCVFLIDNQSETWKSDSGCCYACTYEKCPEKCSFKKTKEQYEKDYLSAERSLQKRDLKRTQITDKSGKKKMVTVVSINESIK